MSNIAVVEQAKKEAKRLLRLAKRQNLEQPHVSIRHLHEAKDVIAKLQGYPGWRAFEDAKLSGIDTSIEAAIQSKVDYGTSTTMETLLAAQEVCEASGTSAPTETVQSDLPANTRVINFAENFKQVSAHNCFKYRTATETHIQYVKQKDMPFVLGTRSVDELRPRGIRNLFNGTKPVDAKISSSTMRTHFVVSGSNSIERVNFLSTLVKTQIANGNPLIYFDGSYNAEMVSYLYTTIKNLGHSKYTSSRLRVLNMCDQPESSSNFSSIDPFEELSPEALCDLLLTDHRIKDMWWGRAYAMLLSVVRALFELRTRISLVIDIPTLEFSLTFEGMSYLFKHPFVSKSVKQDILRYLVSCPGNLINEATMTYEPAMMKNHEFLTMQVISSLDMLRKGYENGYFSITPTDSFQDSLSKNMVFYIATDGEMQSHEETEFLMLLVNRKLAYVLDRPQNRQTHTENSIGLLLFNDCLFTTNEEILSSFFSRSRALGYSCIISSGHFMFDPGIYANTANKTVFHTSEEELRTYRMNYTSTMHDFINLYEQPGLASDISELKAGEFYYFDGYEAIKLKSIESGYLTHDSSVELKVSGLEPRFTLLEVDEFP